MKGSNKVTKKTQVPEKKNIKTIAAATPTMEKTKYKYTHKSSDGKSKKLPIYKTAKGKYVVFVNDKKKYLDMNKMMKGGAQAEEECSIENFAKNDFVNFLTNKETVLNNFNNFDDAIKDGHIDDDCKSYLNNPTLVFKTINGVNYSNPEVGKINDMISFTFEQLKFIIMYKLAYAVINEQDSITDKSLYLSVGSEKMITKLPTIEIKNIFVNKTDTYSGNGMVDAYKYVANTLKHDGYFEYEFFEKLHRSIMRYTRNTLNDDNIYIKNLEIKKPSLCGQKRAKPNASRKQTFI